MSEDDLDDNVKTAKTKPAKKGPGRPKKEIPKKEVPKLGIVNVASNADKTKAPEMVNYLEVVYDNPLMFKKIFNLYSSMGCGTIRMKFTKTEMKIFGFGSKDKDGVVANRIYCKIFCNRINQYYCEDEMENQVELEILQNLVSTNNNETSKIIFYTRRGTKSKRLNLANTDDEICDHQEFSIEVSAVDDTDCWAIEREIEEEQNYNIRFELPSKKFKKKISDYRNCYCDILRIEKEGVRDLKFAYTFNNKKGTLNNYFRQSDVIKMTSNLKPNDLFCTKVKLDHIKSISSSCISDNIGISVDKDRDIIFTAALDHAIGAGKKPIPDTERCIIKVLTKTCGNDTADA